MAKHRPKTSADAPAEVDIHAAVREAGAELDRRKAYGRLMRLERVITDHPPVPDARPMSRLSRMSPSLNDSFTDLSTAAHSPRT
jgi:hypothetical protein